MYDPRCWSLREMNPCLNWDEPGPPPPPECDTASLDCRVKNNLTGWPKLVDSCLNALGEMTGLQEDFVWMPDGRVGERLDAAEDCWIAAAKRGSLYFEMLLGIAHGEWRPVECDLFPVNRAELPSEAEFGLLLSILKKLFDSDPVARTAPCTNQLPLFSFTSDSSLEFRNYGVPERDLGVALEMHSEIANRGDALHTYDTFLEQPYRLKRDSHPENLIEEARDAGFRLIVAQALEADITTSNSEAEVDLKFLYQLHRRLIDAIEDSEAWAEAPNSSLLGCPERDIIRLALPLLRWGWTCKAMKPDDRLDDIIKKASPCDPETWWEFSNSFFRRMGNDGLLPDISTAAQAEFEIELNRVLLVYRNRAAQLGFQVPESFTQVEGARGARNALKNLHLDARLTGRNRHYTAVPESPDTTSNHAVGSNNGKTSPGGDKCASWAFTSSPPEGSMYAFGPLRGKLKEIACWMGKTAPTLRKHNGKRFWYIQDEAGTFAVWFETDEHFKAARRRRNE